MEGLPEGIFAADGAEVRRLLVAAIALEEDLIRTDKSKSKD
jgi:hypothetical protein